MAEFNTLIRKRGSIKAKLTLFKTYIAKTQIALQNQQSTEDEKNLFINELEIRIEKFEPSLSEFEKLQNIIEEHAPDDKLEEQYKERQDFEDEFYNIIAVAKDLVNKNKHNKSVSIKQHADANESVNNVPKQFNHINLPNIKLPSFNGKYENWTEFRNTFVTLIQNNQDLNDLERFHYLRSSLIEDAEGTLRSIPFTAENYAVAWAHVCKRYDNKSMIVINHIKAIDNLPVLQKESFKELSNLLDETNKHLTSWNAVQNTTEQFETLMIHIIKSKLDKYTRMKWEEQKIGDNLPSWKEFNAFLQERTEKLYSRDINNKSEVKQRPTVKTFLVTTNECPVCQEEHIIYKCDKLLALKPEDRLEQIRKLKLCTNCLKSNHTNRDCRAGGCRICKAKHNTLLHFETKAESVAAENNQETNKNVIALSSHIQQTDQISSINNVILSTIQVQVRNRTEYPIVCRALLDSGSQANSISAKLQQKLKLPTQNVHVAVQGINQSAAMLKSRCQVLVESINSNYTTEMMCFVLETMPCKIPNVRIDKIQFNIPTHIKLADPQFHEPQQIDLIIGAPLFWKIMCVGQHNLGDNMPVLQKTRFGWIIGGGMEPIQKPTIIQCNFANTWSIEEQIEKFWSIEEVNQNRILSDDDRNCEEIFAKTITQDSSGRFIVTIPFKESLSLLGNSGEFALQRFHALERRLAMDPILCQQYCQVMKEYEELGHMSEEIGTQTAEFPEYFFPHHGVVNPNSTTTKLRVVFDGSVKSDTGYSINALQYTGPNIQEELINIILRFRMYNVVITADIEKMYRQILVQPDQRSLQKIFWRTKPEEEIKVFKLNTVTYGTASAPFLAVRCLKQLAMNHEQQNPKISRIIAEDFYMDDLITGANTTEEMQNIITAIVAIMKAVGFNLRKWTSNEPETMETHLSLHNTEVHFDTKDNTKILGLYWCNDSDMLKFKINSKIEDNNRITKRMVISELAQIFDPLGLLAPCIIMGKIIIQKLWLLKLSWDESVPLDIHTQWLNFRNQLPMLNEKQIPRQVTCKNATNIQLHGFCDSSERAYGACVYVLSKNNQDVQVNLLCAKTRVAPLKTVTIPRLELCSAVLLSKLIRKVLVALRITINQIYLWSDSTITLNWIQTEPYKLNIFVANRVNQIQNMTNIDNWRYVNTKNNPADLLTRGITPLMLNQSSIWWTGPVWLKETEDQWPQVECDKLDEIPETKRQYVTSMYTGQVSSWIPFNKFSTLSFLKRTIAYCLRFIMNCRLKKESRQYGELTSIELNKAFSQIIKCSQQESFEKEIKDLKEEKIISHKSKLYKLNVFLDDAELLRVGGRLHNSPIPYDQKHPKVLSNVHPLTRLILLHEHIRLLHIGTQGLIASIRQEFWPIAIRNLAKKIVHNCTICFKVKPKSSQAIMGNLPETRVTPSLPFTNVGIDFAGPFMIKNKDGRGWKPIKTYICILICMSTKAIHLEVVSRLSTELFLASLRRFTSRRGKPTNIFSDNGTNFVGANRQINEMYRLITQNQQELVRATTAENITWHFIPPYAPNFGGLWESGVKMMKNHLIKTVKNKILTYEQLTTVLNQIEAILNSRPLLPVTDNPDDLEILTPSHFLIGRTLTSIPDPNIMSVPENRLSVWQKIQQLQQHFWARWQREYLSELQQRQRRGKTETTLKLGDLVIVKDENLPVLKWLVGRITKLFPGNDGITRVVLIKTPHGEIKRAISKLCVLPNEGNDTF